MNTKLLGAGLATALLATPAAADPICRRIDVPGAQGTQGWQIDDAGAVIETSELGSFVYQDGTFRALPAPPPSSGYTAAGIGATAINDAGVIAGAAFPADPLAEASFYLVGGAYTFFDYPSDDYPRTEVRSINANGITTLTAMTPDGSSGIGLVYDPDGAAPYAQGFTPLAPQLDGQDPFFVLPGAINTAGVVVGTARFGGRGAWGFRFDPATGATDVFRVGDSRPARAA